MQNPLIIWLFTGITDYGNSIHIFINTVLPLIDGDHMCRAGKTIIAITEDRFKRHYSSPTSRLLVRKKLTSPSRTKMFEIFRKRK